MNPHFDFNILSEITALENCMLCFRKVIYFWFNVQILREVGFEAVTAEDRTAQFGQIIEKELKNFEQSKVEFVKVT